MRFYIQSLIWFLAAFLVATPAGAAPIIAAIAAFASTTLGGIIVNAVIGVALSFGASLLTGLFSKNQNSKDPGTSVQLRVGGNNPLMFPLGKSATAGVRVYYGTWANSGGTPNEYMVDVLAVSVIPVPGGMTGMWMNDQKVTVRTDLPKTAQGYPIQEYYKNGQYYAWVEFHDGTQTAPNAYLIDKFGSHPNYPWQSDMIGRGVAYVTLTCRYEKDGLWSSGVPSVLIETPSIPLYDPRKDSTNGGSGSHRWGQSETYEPSDNAMVRAYNVARGIYYDGEWVFGGQNWNTYRLPVSSWIAGMNACDVLIDGEPQFHGGGTVEADTEVATVMEELLRSSSALIAEMGGQYKIRVGAPGAPVMAFTDANIVVTREQGYEPFPGLESTYNTAIISYTEPEERWANKESPPRRDTSAIASDDNRELPFSVSLPWVLSNLTAQRIAKTALDNGRRFRRHSMYQAPLFWLIEPLDVVSWTSAHNSYVDKEFDVEQISSSSSMLQSLIIRENDPSDYVWNPLTDLLPYQVVPVTANIVPAQLVSGWQVLPGTIKDEQGRDRKPSIEVRFDGTLSDIDRVLIQVTVDDQLIFDSSVSYPRESITTARILLNGDFPANTECEVRGRFVPFTDRSTEWTGWLSVTTPNVLIDASLDILDDSITSAKIRDAAITASKIMDEAVTELKLADDAVSDAKIQAGAVLEDKLADNAVSLSKIQDGAINAAKFASGVRPVEIVSSLPTTGNFAGRTVFLTTDNKLYRHTGSPTGAAGFTAAVAAVDIDGTITATQIADDSITTPKLSANAVTTAKLAAGAVTADTIDANAITTGKLAAGAVTGDKIAANSITARELVLTDFENLILNGTFAQGFAGWNQAVGTTTLYNKGQGGGSGENSPTPVYAGMNSPSTRLDWGLIPVKAGEEFLFALEGARSSSGTVSAGIRARWYDADMVVLAGSITYETFTNIVWRQYSHAWVAPVGAAFLRPEIVRGSDDSPGRFAFTNVQVIRRKNAELIVDGAIIASKIAAEAITAEKIAANAVTADAILANSITGVKIQGGTITGDKIAGDTITGDLIVANSITARELVLTDFENIIPNPSFNGGSSAGWVLGGGATVTSAPSDSPTPYVVEFPANTLRGQADGIGRQFIPCSPGDEFLMSADVETADASPRVSRLRFRIGWQAADGTQGSTTNIQSWDLDHTDFQTYSTVITAPANCSGIWYIGFERDADVDQSGTMNLTNARFFRRKNANLIVDGAITADKLAANSIVAGKISAGAINASNLFVNGVVITDVIAQNAVTAVTSAYTAGSTTANGTVQTLVVASQSGWRHIITSEVIVTAGTVGTGTVELRNGSTVLRQATIGVLNSAGVSFVVSYEGELNSGNNTITLVINAPFANVSGRLIQNLLTKR